MRLTVSTYSFEVVPLETTLAICQSMGFKGVVIGGFHNRGKASYEPEQVAAEPQRWADHLNGLLDKYELDAVDFFPQFANAFPDRAVNHPDASIRQKNLDAFPGIVEFCRLTHIHGITVLPGTRFYERTEEEDMDSAAVSLARYVEMAGAKGIDIYFEPHMGSLVEKPELALMLAERVTGIKVALDYSHFVAQGIEVERVHPLIPYTGTFHIRQAREGTLQTHYHRGVIDFVDIIRRLEAVGYQDCLSIEYVYADWFGLNQLDTLTETAVTKAALEPYVSL